MFRGLEVSERPGKYLAVRKEDPPGLGKTKQKRRQMIRYLIERKISPRRAKGMPDV
jgi:hypothetical protein